MENVAQFSLPFAARANGTNLSAEYHPMHVLYTDTPTQGGLWWLSRNMARLSIAGRRGRLPINIYLNIHLCLSLCTYIHCEIFKAWDTQALKSDCTLFCTVKDKGLWFFYWYSLIRKYNYHCLAPSQSIAPGASRVLEIYSVRICHNSFAR